MEQQIFSRELQGTFNLREPKGTKPTMIYFVVRLNGKQYKFTTGVKVYPSMWSKTTQTAIVSNQQTKEDNRNNKIVNDTISEILTNFSNYISYLCNTEQKGNEYNILRNYIYKDMKTKDVNVIKIIENAFDYFYKYINPSAKVSTMRTNEQSLNIFKNYIMENELEKDIKVFSQSGFNGYRDYLISKGNAPKRINQLCQLVARLINKVLCVNDEYQKYNFTHIEFNTLKDKRKNEEIGHFPLNEDEIKKLKDCKGLSDRLDKVRNTFLFECKCGWRYEDVCRFMRGDYEQKGNVITIKTEKKEIPAYLNVDDEVKELIEKLKGVEPKDRSGYNRDLKTLAEKAKLDRIVTYKDSKGVEHSKPIYNVISSHWARHTMITNEVRKGTPIEIIIKKSGHADDTMVRKIYTKLTKDEKIQSFADYYDNRKDNTKKDGLQVLFAYDELKKVQSEGYNTPSAKIAISKIKDISELSNYDTIDKEKVLDLEPIVFYLAYYNKDMDLYRTFEFKMKYFGIIDKYSNIADNVERLKDHLKKNSYFNTFTNKVDSIKTMEFLNSLYMDNQENEIKDYLERT